MIVVELLGSTFGAPLLTSCVFFIAVALIVLRTPASAASGIEPSCAVPQPEPLGAARQVLRWSLGWLLAGTGLALLGGAVLPLLGAGSPRWAHPDPTLGVPLALTGCWLLAVGSAWACGRHATWRDLERSGLLMGVVFLGLFASGYRVQGLPVFPQEPWAGSLASALALVLVGLAVTAGRARPSRWVLLLGVGLLVRGVGLTVWQPDPVVRDMLPLIQSAGDALARGEEPYQLYAMQRGSVIPLTYLPGMWGLHNLPRLLGFPLRTASIAADLGVVCSLWWLGRERERRGSVVASGGALGLGALWLLSPSVQWNAIYAEPHPWWALLALGLACAIRGRWLCSALLLGMAMATRQLAWFLAPFWALWALRTLGAKAGLRYVAWAGAVALTAVAPLALADPGSFWFGTVRWFPIYGSVHRSWFVERLGFAGTLYSGGQEALLMPLQACVAALALGIAAAARTPRGLLQAMAIGYVAFIMLSPVIWDSFYLGAFVLVAVVVLGAGELSRFCAAAAAPPSRAREWLVLLSVLCVEAGLLSWLAYGYWASASERGLTASAAAVGEQLRAGDVLLDRARRRVTFAQPALSVDPVQGARVVGSILEPALPDWGWLSSQRPALLFRPDRDAAIAARMARLGEVVAEDGQGFFAWMVVEPRAAVGSLRDGFVRAFPPPAPRQAEQDASGPGSCLIGGRWRPALLARASRDAASFLRFAVPSAAESVLLAASFTEGGIVWGRRGAEIQVRQAEALMGTLPLRNLPEVNWDVFALRGSPAGHQLEVRLSIPDEGERTVCLHGIWLGSVFKAEPEPDRFE